VGTLPRAFVWSSRTCVASFCCLHWLLAFVQCCVSSMLRIANLGFSYKDDDGYILNPSELKYNYSSSLLHPYLQLKAFLLNSIKPCRPQTSWYCLSIPVSTEHQPCLPDVPVPTVPVPTIPVPRRVRNHLYHPNHALPPVLRRSKPTSIAANANMVLSC
jgi:hypothetical protein